MKQKRNIILISISSITAIILFSIFSYNGKINQKKVLNNQSDSVEYVSPKRSIDVEKNAIEEQKKAFENKIPTEKKFGNGIGILKVETVDLEVAITYGLSSDGTKTKEGKNVNLIDNKASILENSAVPGENKQIYVAGHNDQSFAKLKDIQFGAEITFTTSEKTFKYIYKESKIVDETEVSVINNNLNTEELVLQTCYPFEGTKNPTQRILFYAYPVN